MCMQCTLMHICIYMHTSMYLCNAKNSTIHCNEHGMCPMHLLSTFVSSCVVVNTLCYLLRLHLVCIFVSSGPKT